MPKSVLLVSILALGTTAAGCMTSDEATPEQPPKPAGKCNAAPAQYHIGHDATQEMGAAILAESGAKTLRWGPPNSAWTMDYREDRVNVRYDENNKIVEITCG